MSKLLPAGFDDFYRSIYGARWVDISKSLRQEPRYVALSIAGGPAYYVDEASRFAAEVVEPQPGFRVLDLCAAPGGKTLVLANALGEAGRLTSNERSRTRRQRLYRVINEHLPESISREIRVTGFDARSWCLHEKDAYDSILLDAPCSAERHLVNKPNELAKWSASRTKRLSAQSYAMLASALDVVITGGTIVYCTCTLSPLENDEVIAKLLAKRSGRVEIGAIDCEWGEATEHGHRILPDTAEGRGPLYICKIRRLC